METTIYVLASAFVVAYWAAFILLFSYKLGFVEWMQVHGGSFISKMAHCDFCMCWWLCLILTLIIVSITGDITQLCVPFIATPIARRVV